MKKTLISIVVPPMAACRYGCGTSCAGPISIFWVAGIIAVIYAFMGGPASLAGLDYYTLLLGLALWAIATVWTMLTMSGVEEDRCQGIFSPLNNKVIPKLDESDPFDEIQKLK